VSLVNNGGNIADTLKELGSKDSLKNILISMTTAGVVSGMNSAFFGEGSAFLTGQTGDNANAIINNQVANQFANNVIKGTGQVLGAAANSALGNAVLGAVGNSVLKLTPEAVVIGGGISGGVNAGAQYLFNDKVDWGNVGITAAVGALTFGAVFLYTVGANGAAGGYMNYKQGDSIVTGALIGGGSAGLGWAAGTAFTNGFNPVFNPIRNSYIFYPPAAGSYFLRTPPVSPVPNILGGVGSSSATEYSGYQINKVPNQVPNRGKK
jgi:hypothetical protein